MQTANAPFCQQKLPENFETDIASCFDEQYQNDQSALAEFQAVYKGWTQSILDVFEGNLTNVFPKLDIDSYKDKVAHLQTVITANLRQIEKKIDKPA